MVDSRIWGRAITTIIRHPAIPVPTKPRLWWRWAASRSRCSISLTCSRASAAAEPKGMTPTTTRKIVRRAKGEYGISPSANGPKGSAIRSSRRQTGARSEPSLRKRAALDRHIGECKWDTSSLRSSYANFCNANSTREEVVLNFGVNKTWERGPQESLEIELNHPHRAESVCRKAADRAIEQAHTGVR